jgi:hypothetical protein
LLLKGLAVPLEILDIVGVFQDVVGLQESIQLISGLKTQKPPGFEGRKRPGNCALWRGEGKPRSRN